MAVTPEHFNRRSFIYPRLIEAGAEFAEVTDAAVAARYPHDAPALGLVDLSPLPRTGIKGPKALDWLSEQGWPVPEDNNQAAHTESGGLVLRLGNREAFVLAGARSDGDTVRMLERSIPGDGAWPMPRRDSHAWFMLRGDAAIDCMAKLCGVDLREAKFPRGAIAQTSVARLNTIVCRDVAGAKPGFHLLADSASAIWFWDALLDAMQEFGGGPLGTHELD
jgi:sarcosine oxidase subunit gamma